MLVLANIFYNDLMLCILLFLLAVLAKYTFIQIVNFFLLEEEVEERQGAVVYIIIQYYNTDALLS